jgi:hypothetical protein
MIPLRRNEFLRLVPPCIPARDALAREQFDIRTSNQTFDPAVNAFRLSGMLAAQFDNALSNAGIKALGRAAELVRAAADLEASIASWVGDHSQTTLWQIEKNLKPETGHGTQKPVECHIRELLQRNLQEVFGEGNATRRRAAIEELYTEDGALDAPPGIFVGPEALDKFANPVPASGDAMAEVFRRAGLRSRRSPGLAAWSCRGRAQTAPWRAPAAFVTVAAWLLILAAAPAGRPITVVSHSRWQDKTGSHLTPRWREMDSNFRFRCVRRS